MEMIEFISEDALIFTLEDLKNAEKRGYARGFAPGSEQGIMQGELKAKNELDEFLKEVVSQINQSLKTIIELEQTFLDGFFPNILRICLMVLEKVMPHFFQTNGMDEMEKILKKVIESLIISEPIKVRVSELAHEIVVKRLQDTCAEYPETIEILKDPRIVEGACKVEWVGGGAKWSLNERIQEIEKKLQEYLTLNVS